MAREMKDSGVEWIGEMPRTWKLSKIGQAYSERRTKVSDRDYPPLSVTMKGILPQLDTAAKTDAHDDRKLLCRGDFAINSRSDRRGACGISQVDGSVSLINIVLQPKAEMNSQYYEWVFHSTMFSDEFYKWGHGIVDDLWTTGWQDMKKIAIPAPKLQEQKRIAMFLNEQCSELDNILLKTRASIAEYKKLRQAVITQTVTQGVRGDREMKDTDNVRWGKIPFDWNLIKIKNCITDLKSGLSAVTSDEEAKESGYYVLRTSAVSSGVFLSEEVKPVVTSVINRLVCPVEKDTIVVSRMNTSAMVGTCAYVDNEYPNLFLPDKLWKIHIKKEYYTKFFWYVINSVPARSLFAEISTGASMSMQNISVTDFINNYVTVPPLDEQKEIAHYLDQKCSAIDDLIAKKEKYLLEIENYKKSLIYEYATGKKEVPQEY